MYGYFKLELADFYFLAYNKVASLPIYTLEKAPLIKIYSA